MEKELREQWDNLEHSYEWEKFLENAKAFNSKYKDCYPNQGDAPIELIIEKITEKDFYI